MAGRILIVDDDTTVRELLYDILDGQGYEVVALGSAMAALKEGQQKSFNLLLADIRMPEMDGLELVRRFREMNPQVVAILITGYPSVETARVAIRGGVYDYIVKPVQKNELCTIVANALKRQEHIAALEKTARELEQLESIRSGFVNVLAHELKTSLTPVLGSASLLADQHKDGSGVEDRLAHNILAGAEAMGSQLENLLTLARLEIGAIVLQIDEINVKELLSAVVSQIKPLAVSRKQDLMAEIPQELPLIKADAHFVEMVLINLLENAVKSAPEGGSIRIKASITGGELTVGIQDNGRSLSDEERQKLFQPYWRSEVDSQPLSGAGLGLAICQRLVELHQGKIWIDSVIGGKTFFFSLPVAGPRT